MSAKVQRNYLRISGEVWPFGSDSPHLQYANLDFSHPKLERHARHLLRWVDLAWPNGWAHTRTLNFLKEHQAEFCRCLRWLSEGAVVDFGHEGKKAEDFDEQRELRKAWKQGKAITFLQAHGIDHGAISLEPRIQEGNYFEGLKLDQDAAKDPLDPICWYVLALLSSWGTIFVRQCRRLKCGRFYWPQKVTKRFCSDSCRAQDHQMHARWDAVEKTLEYDELGETEKYKTDPKGRFTDDFHVRQRAFVKKTRRSMKERDALRQAAKRRNALKTVKSLDGRRRSKGLAPFLDKTGGRLR